MHTYIHTYIHDSRLRAPEPYVNTACVGESKHNMCMYIYMHTYKHTYIHDSRLHAPAPYANTTCTATCKINGNFQQFSTADLYQFTIGTPSERFPFIKQVAVCVKVNKIYLYVYIYIYIYIYIYKYMHTYIRD